MDIPVNCRYNFYLDGNCNLIVSLPEGESNHFVLDDIGNIGYNMNVED